MEHYQIQIGKFCFCKVSEVFHQLDEILSVGFGFGFGFDSGFGSGSGSGSGSGIFFAVWQNGSVVKLKPTDGFR